MNVFPVLHCVAIGVAVLASASAGQIASSQPATRPTLTIVNVPRLGIDVRNFVQVSYLQPGGPAEAAGVKAEDILLGIDASPIQTARELIQRFQSMDRQAPVTLVIRRAGKNVAVKLTLDQWAEASATPADKRGRAGMALSTLMVTTDADGNGLGRRLGISRGTVIQRPGDSDGRADAFAEWVAAWDRRQPLGLHLRNGADEVGAELHPDDRPAPVGIDVLHARTSPNRQGVSALLNEAAADAKAFEQKYGNRVIRLAAVVSSVGEDGGYVSLRGNGHFERNDRSVHSSSLRITDPALRAKYSGTVPGQVLFVDAQLRSVRSERVANDRVDAGLDGPPRETTIAAARIVWTVVK